jgi:hypothetical protein|tara:strand:+ start:83 stop:241 length:159 start_codon:yes stop_codon:yes gene_type:complete
MDMEDWHTQQMNERMDLVRYGPINVDEARQQDLERTARYNRKVEEEGGEQDA